MRSLRRPRCAPHIKIEDLMCGGRVDRIWWAKPGWVFALSIIMSASLTLSGCDQPPPPGANQQGPGKRPQRLALSPEEELELGRQAYRKVLAEMRGSVLPADHPDV